MKEKFACIILAAGKGTRMNEGKASPIPKVMFEILGKPMIHYSVKSVQDAGVNKIILVIGYEKEMVMDYFKDQVDYVNQEEQLGTGHAVMMAKDKLQNQAESVIIFYGDNPLYKSETIKKLISLYEKPARRSLGEDGEKPTIAMLSVIFEDPMFWVFGRITRDKDNEVTGIVEQKDCTKEQLKIKECNPGFYIFDAQWLWQNIDNLKPANVQKEYYLTDLVEMAVAQNKRVVAMPVSEENEAWGINTLEQLKQAEEVLKKRKV